MEDGGCGDSRTGPCPACGLRLWLRNRDWARTYQAVPALIEQQLIRAGARLVVPRGAANGRGNFFGDFDDWYDGFWGPASAAFDQGAQEPRPTPLLQLDFTGAARDPIIRANSVQLGTVIANRELVDVSVPGARSKRHLEIALPDGMTYRCGDYLAVLPLNPVAVVERALARFGLAYDAMVEIHVEPGGRTFLPVDSGITVGELLTSYVDLNQPATRPQLRQLADVTPCPPDRQRLSELAEDERLYNDEILDQRVSVLDVLVRYPACQLAFASFLGLLGPLTPRQYSISSSPMWSDNHASLTVAVLRNPARSGSGTFEGVASTYLANARPGSRIAVAVRRRTSPSTRRAT